MAKIFNKIGFMVNSKKTFKPLKGHKNSKQQSLHDYSRKTLGSGNMRLAVQLPRSEPLNEWLSVNTIDFFNEVSLLYGVVIDDTGRFSQPGEGFPPGYEYRWLPEQKANERKPVAIKCSAPQYVDYAITWVEDQINSDDVFSTSDGAYPKDFKKIVTTIFKRLFRVYAIIYCGHFENIEELGAAAHLNTSFKHFIFFALEFDILPQKEMEPLKTLVAPLIEEFRASSI